MPQKKWAAAADPSSDLELELFHIRVLSEMLGVARDTQEDEHVAYLISQLPRHAGAAWKAFEALTKQEHAQ